MAGFNTLLPLGPEGVAINWHSWMQMAGWLRLSRWISLKAGLSL
jgi:hypothetical protein